eukprot:TRINITY_DN5002_c0_g1_i1.p1 TRINITY_DN5002_c0_g1~~TRINITY_DN5002_c0_g1_i1.p1  ORF type:complete len:555 (+),score=106.73 TRINITY_DN5002_c0_g1_i1:54-1718(+)
MSLAARDEISHGCDSGRNATTLHVKARVKLDELFVHWLSLPDTHARIRALVPALQSLDAPQSPQAPAKHYEFLSESSPPPRSPKSPNRSKSMQQSRVDVPKSPTANPYRSLPASPSSVLAHSTKRKQERIPQFYFPNTKKVSQEQMEEEMKLIIKLFGSKDGSSMGKEQFQLVTQELCHFPSFFNEQLYLRVSSLGQGNINHTSFMQFWTTYMKDYDLETRWFNVVKQPENDFILPTDFTLIMNAILETHPALDFLKQTSEFQERYAETVIIRIFYKVNRSESGRITLSELKKSNLVKVFDQLDSEQDINRILEYFSYEHFYVLYCKFWELDTDHDHVINQNDLQKYASHSLTHRVIERIFMQIPKKFTSSKPGTMNYADFCWFLLSEEDKTTETSIEYWFRVLDLDGDGYVSLYEMEYFYVEQIHRMNCLSIEHVDFQDILCQMVDMLKPKSVTQVTVSDFKRCKLAAHVFNILFNLNKFIAFEQRDPFTIRQEMNAAEKTDWDRFARAEYDLLAAEEEEEDDDDAAHYIEKSKYESWGGKTSRGGVHNESPF